MIMSAPHGSRTARRQPGGRHLGGQCAASDTLLKTL